MKAFRITRNSSDYPYLVIAKDLHSAILTYITNVESDSHITNIVALKEYDNNICVEQ